jgi:hypothetical protein
VRNQAGRRQRPAALLVQIEERSLDDVDGTAAGDLGVGLNVGDEQFDRTEIVRDHVAHPRREIGRKQTGVLRPWRVDD